MYSDEELTSAVAAGVMTEEVATAFRNHVAQERTMPAVDEEHFRLVTGFNDIFVVIACALLLVSVTWIGGSVSPSFGHILQAAAAWGLAEYFTLKRRMSLPSIVLLLVFVAGIFATGLELLSNSGLSSDLATGLPSAVAAFAAWLHWKRFKVPITVAAGTGTLAASSILLLVGFIPEIRPLILPLVFFTGIAVFFLAMRWDSSDTKRQTGRSDVAFWLHLLAAPMIVHPVFSLLMSAESNVGILQAAIVITLYIVIALVSISIDRRALMVSALAYVLYAINAILEVYGVVSLGFAFTAFAIGSGLLLLSAFWHVCRQAVLVYYPEQLREHLPALR